VTYAEKLKDPRWQKKRLQILERDNWKCQACGDTKSTLVVHHRRYLPGKEPWEYREHLLVTLCEDCHEIEREVRPEYEDMLLTILREKFFADDIYEFTSGLVHMELQHESRVVAKVYGKALASKEIQAELLRRFGGRNADD